MFCWVNLGQLDNKNQKKILLPVRQRQKDKKRERQKERQKEREREREKILLPIILSGFNRKQKR
jgi:hypothetical protein